MMVEFTSGIAVGPLVGIVTVSGAVVVSVAFVTGGGAYVSGAPVPDGTVELPVPGGRIVSGRLTVGSVETGTVVGFVSVGVPVAFAVGPSASVTSDTTLLSKPPMGPRGPSLEVADTTPVGASKIPDELDEEEVGTGDADVEPDDWLNAVEFDAPVGLDGLVLLLLALGRMMRGGGREPVDAGPVAVSLVPVFDDAEVGKELKLDPESEPESVGESDSESDPEPVAESVAEAAADEGTSVLDGFGGTTMVLATTTVVTLLSMAAFNKPVLEVELGFAAPWPAKLLNKSPREGSFLVDWNSGTPAAETVASSAVEVALVYWRFTCRGK